MQPNNNVMAVFGWVFALKKENSVRKSNYFLQQTNDDDDNEKGKKYIYIHHIQIMFDPLSLLLNDSWKNRNVYKMLLEHFSCQTFFLGHTRL